MLVECHTRYDVYGATSKEHSHEHGVAVHRRLGATFARIVAAEPVHKNDAVFAA